MKLNLFTLFEAHVEYARRTRFYFSCGGENKDAGPSRMAAFMRQLGIAHTAEDLSKEIPVHHAYRFLIPETGGDNIYRLLREVFAAAPRS